MAIVGQPGWIIRLPAQVMAVDGETVGDAKIEDGIGLAEGIVSLLGMGGGPFHLIFRREEVEFAPQSVVIGLFAQRRITDRRPD
jgi:hypothetical protein